MHEATAQGFIDVVDLLLDNGADIESIDYDGARCVHIAARNGRLEILQLLLQRGAQIESLDNEGKSCIYYAAYQSDEYDWITQENRLDCIRFLLDKGAKVDFEHLDECYRTAIELAQNRV